MVFILAWAGVLALSVFNGCVADRMGLMSIPWCALSGGCYGYFVLGRVIF